MASGTYIPSANVPILSLTNNYKSMLGNINLSPTNKLYDKNNILIGGDHNINGYNNFIAGDGHTINGNNVVVLGGNNFETSVDNRTNILSSSIYKQKNVDIGAVTELEHYLTTDDFLAQYPGITLNSSLSYFNLIGVNTTFIYDGTWFQYKDISIKLLFNTNAVTSGDVMTIDLSTFWNGATDGCLQFYIDSIGSGPLQISPATHKFSNINSIFSVWKDINTSPPQVNRYVFNHNEVGMGSTPQLQVLASSPQTVRITFNGGGDISNMNFNMDIKIQYIRYWNP